MSRLFFALIPEKSTRADINQAIQQINPDKYEKIIKNEKLHITLRYLGNVSTDVLKEINRSVDNIKQPEFSLTIDKLEYWKRPSLSVLIPSKIPKPLTDLVAELEKICIACGLTEESRAYKPHVTIIRKSLDHQSGHNLKTVNWKVKNFVLLNSETVDGKVIYTKIGQWGLLSEV